jgi:HEPN domain-containing protein
MGFYAEPWLREARDRINAHSKQFPGAIHSYATEFEKISEAVEKAIKAALVERHGSIPQKHDHDKLVSLCETTGVWEILPPALRRLVQEVESYHIANRPGTVEPAASSPEQLQNYFFIARRLIDYVEDHVIGNDSVLRRLQVA